MSGRRLRWRNGIAWANDGPDASRSFVAHAIYGEITILAGLQVMEVHPPSAWRGALTLFGTTLAVALVHIYADGIADMLDRKGRLTRHDLAETVRDVAPVLVGTQGPTILLILSAFGLMPVVNAIDLAQVAVFVSLFGYGWHIGSLIDGRWTRRLLSALVLTTIGALIVGVKVAFH